MEEYKHRGKPRLHRNYRFSNLSVRRIIINPEVEGYPAIFLLCRRGLKSPPFLIGMEFVQINWLLMEVFEGEHRLHIASKLGEILSQDPAWGEIPLSRTFRGGLPMNNLSMRTKLRRFDLEELADQSPLYFFELIELQNFKGNSTT